MVGTIICEVGIIICNIGTINMRFFYLLEVRYPYGYCRIIPYLDNKYLTTVTQHSLQL